MKNVGIILALVVVTALIWWGTSFEAINVPSGSETAPALPASAFTPGVIENPIPGATVPGAAFRAFDVVLTQSGVSPSSITVGKGDRVQFNIKAADAQYDFVVEIPKYEFYVTAIEQGTTRAVGFEVPVAGAFTFGCRQRCPGPNDPRLTAQLIVLDR